MYRANYEMQITNQLALENLADSTMREASLAQMVSAAAAVTVVFEEQELVQAYLE